MKILLFGPHGQLGWQLRRSLGIAGEVIAAERTSGHLGGDLEDPSGVAATVTTVRPNVVLIAGAYTAVDRAEDEPERAWKVNADAPGAIARAAAQAGAWVIHYSTDYVYDGTGTRPWREEDTTGPLSVYGRTKLAGDQAVAGANPRHVILRTSWVFDTWGHNFAKTMLRLAATRDTLQVVSDQWGAPTRAALLADITAHIVLRIRAGVSANHIAGLFHAAPTGETNWCDYARYVLQQAHRVGWALRVAPEQVQAIATAAYPTRAPRPGNSRLDTRKLCDTFGMALPTWQDGVRAVVAELAEAREQP